MDNRDQTDTSTADDEGWEPEPTPLSGEFSDHSLSERYFLGYTTAKTLDEDLDRVRIESFGGDRDEYIFCRNHCFRSRVEGDTKVIEVPIHQLGEHIYKVYDTLRKAGVLDRDLTLEYGLDRSGGDRYAATDDLVADHIEAFYDDLQPEGTVVLCRPENFLSELLQKGYNHDRDYKGEFLTSSNKYLERITRDDITWEDAYETFEGVHPKFENVDEMIAEIRSTTDLDLTIASEMDGVFRGFKVTLPDKTLTLVSRGWGRELAYSMADRLADGYEDEVSSVLFLGGCGALDSDIELNDLVVPEGFSAPGEPMLSFDNHFLDFSEFTETTEYHRCDDLRCVNSPADETTDFMLDLADDGVAAVEMEGYGLVKALKGTDISLGAVYFAMDIPLKGIDLGKTSYDPEFKKKIVYRGEPLTIEKTMQMYGLLDDPVQVAR